MSQTIHMLQAIVSSKIDAFTSGINKAIGVTGQFAGAWKDAAASIDRAATRIGASVTAAVGGLSAVVAKAGISFLSMKEQAEISFETMLGSAQKAQAMVRELADFAAKTPFEMKGLLKSTQMLLAFGFKARDIIPMLTAVGDAVAGLGGSPEQLNQVVRALGQIQAKGKASAEEMLQLAEVGIPSWDMLAKKLGTDTAGAMKLVEKGAVDASTTIAAMVEGMTARFGGLMEKQSKSFSGLWSTMKDNFSQNAATVVEPLFNALRDGMAKVNASIDPKTSKAWVEGLRAGVQQAVNAFNAAAPQIQAFFQSVVRGALEALPRVIDWLMRLPAAAREVWQTLQPLVSAFGAVARAIGEFVAKHPEVAVMFAAFKVANLFGITDALLGLSKALFSTAKAFVALATEGKAASAVMLNLKTLGFGAALLVIEEIARAIYNTNKNIKDFRNEVERMEKLDVAGRKRDERDRDKKIRNIESLPEINRAGAFEAEIREAEKNLAGKKRNARLAQEDLDSAFPDEKGVTGRSKRDWARIAGSKELERSETDLKRAEKAVEEQEEYIARLRDLLEKELERVKAEAKAREEMKKAEAGGAPVAGGGPAAAGPGLAGLGGGGAGGGGRKTVESMLEAQLEKAENRVVSGAADLKDFVNMPGVTPDQVRQFAGAMKGATPETADEFSRHFAAAGGDRGALDKLADEFAAFLQQELETAKRMKEGEQIQGKLDARAGALTPQAPGSATQIEGIRAAGAQATQQFQAGGMSEETYRQTLSDLNEKLGDLERQAKQSAEATTDLKTKLGDYQQKGYLSAQAQQQLNQSIDDNKRALDEGRINFDQYKEKLREIGQTAQNVAMASPAASMDAFRKKLEELQLGGRLSAQQMQFFNAALNQLDLALQKGTISAQQFDAMLDQLSQQLSQASFGGGGMGGMFSGMGLPPFMEQIFNMGFGGGRPVNLGMPGDWFQKAAKANDQNLGWSGGGGGGVPAGPPTPMQAIATAVGSRLKESMPYADSFAQVATKLVTLADTFNRTVSGGSVAGMNAPLMGAKMGPGAGPGMTTNGGMGTQVDAAQITLSFPSLTKFSNAEVRQMVDMFRAELERQGRTL